MANASAKTLARVKARQTVREANSQSNVNQVQPSNKHKHNGWEMSAHDALKVNFVDTEICTLIDK